MYIFIFYHVFSLESHVPWETVITTTPFFEYTGKRKCKIFEKMYKISGEMNKNRENIAGIRQKQSKKKERNTKHIFRIGKLCYDHKKCMDSGGYVAGHADMSI